MSTASGREIDATGPFLRRDAVAAGVCDETLRGSSYRRLFQGVHVRADVPVTLALRARAAQAVAGPAAILSHQTAAQLWGGVVPETATIHLIVPKDRRLLRDGIIAHRHVQDVTSTPRFGLPVTPAPVTFAHLAASLDLVDLVVLGDSLVRVGATTPTALVAFCSRYRGRRVRVARRAASLVRSGVDSPQETRLRLLIVLGGLPEPVVDHRVYHEDGTLRRRFDLAFPELRVAIEYDGAHHGLDLQRGQDLLRREELEACGWVIVTIVAGHLFGHPADVLARVERVMVARGGPRRRRVDEWRRHFVSRASTR